MATSFGLEAFARRMRVVGGAIGIGVEKAVRRAAIAADSTVVQATPVDTGRARANWFVSIGNPVFTATDAVDPSGAGAISSGRAIASTWKLGQGPIFISNSVPYIVPLDQGSSRQAPFGMTSLAIQAARRQLAGFRILAELR